MGIYNMGIFVNKKVIELSNVPDEKIRKIVWRG